MAVCSLRVTGLLLLVLLTAYPAHACFGPKLFLGIPEEMRGQVLTSLVTIYVKEKTGVETERVALEGRDVTREILAEKLDFGFADRAAEGLQAILVVDGLPMLVSGPRILSDLQFTTVGPALKRLERQLKPAHVEEILRDVSGGELPMAAARRFLMQRRWI